MLTSKHSSWNSIKYFTEKTYLNYLRESAHKTLQASSKARVWAFNWVTLLEIWVLSDLGPDFYIIINKSVSYTQGGGSLIILRCAYILHDNTGHLETLSAQPQGRPGSAPAGLAALPIVTSKHLRKATQGREGLLWLSVLGCVVAGKLGL